MGGAYVVSKSNAAAPRTEDNYPDEGEGGSRRKSRTGGALVEASPVSEAWVGHSTKGHSSERNALLLEAMKEELFQLEIDRQQGKISPEEYAKAKAALDETIKRALARGRSS